MNRLFLVGVVALTLTGCDTMYGVSRSAPITIEPAVSCVNKVISSAPSVTSVRHKVQQGGRPITLSGVKSPTVVHTFFYSGPNYVRAVLQYTKDYEGNLTFEQSVFRINAAPPQKQVTATRKTMLYIEKGLESECGLIGLPENVDETCLGVDCPTIHSSGRAQSRAPLNSRR